nr:ABC transporter permease subunit [Symbiobacterium terraclitae]
MDPVDQYLVVALGKGTMLVPVLYGALLALSVVTREVDRRTVDFLLSLPVGRTRLLGARVAVLLVNLTLMVAAVWAAFRLDMAAQGYQGSWGHFGAAMVNLWLLAVAFSCVILAASMWVDDYSMGVKLFLGAVAFAYLMEFVLKGATVSRAGRVLSPFSYVDVARVLRTGAFAADALVLALAAAAGLAISFWAFKRKQFPA